MVDYDEVNIWDVTERLSDEFLMTLVYMGLVSRNEEDELFRDIQVIGVCDAFDGRIDREAKVHIILEVVEENFRFAYTEVLVFSVVT
jgi:hypothetical protein